MKKAAVLLVVICALFSAAFGQKPAIVTDNEQGWQKIGETTASFKEQDESIHVWGADEFKAIKLKVEDAGLEITRMQIFYESGDMEEIDVKKKLQAGEESDEFTLKHAERDIAKVAFTYHSLPNEAGDKAKVELHGIKEGDEDSEAYRKDDMDRAEEDAEEAAENTEEDIERAAEETEQEAEEAANEAEEEIEEAEREIEEGADTTESDLERAAEETGDAISKAAANVGAAVTDEIVDDKVGPEGQTIYIDPEDEGTKAEKQFYYINDEGKKVYITKTEMKDKKKYKKDNDNDDN